MSFLGNVLSFENFKLGNMWDKIKENPEQLLLGAGDPFSAKLWGGITGKEYSPLVDQWGGATKDDYQKAEAAGIDTGAGRAMHGLAKAVAGSYAGGYGMKQFPTGSQSGGLLDFSGGQEAAPITDLSTTATPQQVQGMQAASSQSGGMAGAWDQYGKPAKAALEGASMAKGLLDSPQQQVQAPQLPQGGSDLSAIIQSNNAQLDALKQKRAQRQGLLGNQYG